MDFEMLIAVVFKVFIATSFCLFAGLGILQLFNCKLPVKYLRNLIETIFLLQLLNATLLIGFLSFSNLPRIEVHLGYLLHVQHFELPLIFSIEQRISFYLLTAQIIFAVAIRFSSAYLYRETGLQRFMFLMSLCQFGVTLVVASRHLSLLFFGWECVGIASTLLISFFWQNSCSVLRSAKAFSSYRISDMGLIIAAALLHTSIHSDDLFAGQIVVQGHHLVLLELAGLALIFGSLAKGGVFPFMTWMPKALEGPTPSSAVFYGALSVHLAPLLLLRTADIWWQFELLRIFVAGLGFITLILAAAIGRTQTNIKTQLVYAVMAQIGVMYVELALGFRDFVMFHMCSHALLRTHQFLRSGSLLSDQFERADFFHIQEDKFFALIKSKVSFPFQKLFIHAWNGFYLDNISALIFRLPTKVLGEKILKSINRVSFSTNKEMRDK